MKNIINMTKKELQDEILKMETRYTDMLKLLSIYNTQMYHCTDLKQVKFWCNEMLEKACLLDTERSAELLFKLTDKKKVNSSDKKAKDEKRIRKKII